jgi:Ca2+-binding RTX toxin-like protein
MGPNVLFAGRPQGGGITYGDIEVVQVELGRGNDTVRVDYATNAEDHATKRTGDFYTLTILNTGGGNDNVTVALDHGDSTDSFDGSGGDGAFALNTGDGNDTVSAAASTRPLVVFGGPGQDDITTGSGDDIVFGDVGRVDYTKKITVDGDEYDAVVTRLGSSVPQNPQNPHVTFATNTTITDSAILGTPYQFPTDYEGLVGLNMQVISPEGHVQYRTVIANTADTITVDTPWDEFPVYNAADPNDNYYYRISSYPDDQTDGLFRGPRVIWTVNDNVGGNDTIFSGAGGDIVIGGAANDTVDSGAGLDQVAGDDARFDFVPVTGDVARTRLLRITDPGTIGDDNLTGGDDPDLLIGGLGNDIISGGGNNDILIGDAATVLFAVDGLTPVQIETTDRDNGGVDTIYGGAGDDIVIGGSKADLLDGGAGRDLIFGDNVLLVRNAGSGDAIDPRFRALTGTVIYDANGAAQVAGQFAAPVQPVPGGRPAWADWTITLDQTFIAAHFGNDYIAGGAGDDEIFGQLGDDVIQGDGSIDVSMTGGQLVSASRDASGNLVLHPSFDAATDGDDYIEGGPGSDVIFGNQGQDDILGGSSDLFSLASSALRPDGSDLLFGGSGTHVARNDIGDATADGNQVITTTANGHANDSDMILGDNGDIFRLVGTNGAAGNPAAYLTFNYDNYGTRKIVVRAARLLDYTPGGPDFNPAGAATDIGAADEIHGESGDDFIYGMKGGDALYGDGQDDDLIGGYGNDWISGGTGNDGILGDDGRISTSRNGSTEPLNGMTAAVQPATIATGGNMQQANINVAGQLKKSVNLTPFSTDATWTPAVDEWGGVTGKTSDDIIFGGWGDDFLHGGSGDDAISGAEALSVSYAPTYDAQGNPNGLVQIDYNHPSNPGNALAFNPIDVNAAHANRKRAGEFALYDEYDPLRKVLLTAGGSASKWTAGSTPTGVEFFLNFAAAEGPAAALDATKKSDGDDKIFGDLGNDWLVGGSGRDDLYGGFGNDLLNADDDLTTAASMNNAPDTSASYEDRAFGGAGRDVLIANTGGDRLIDWSGEYNSYLVPFSPFGMATISRSVQPALQDFLYALSASDGADPTRAADTGSDAARNGEPWGELGLVLQKDAAWRDQHGGPADPQPGNSTGARDVLRSANFNSGTAQGFTPQIGTFSVANNRYQVAPSTSGGDAISLFNTSDTVIPIYFEFQATINAVKPTSGNKANAFLIFDWQSNTDFKFAGIDVSINRILIGHRNASGWITDAWTNYQLKAGNDYVVMLKVSGSAVTMTLGTTNLSYTFAPRVDSLGVSHGINDGVAGIGATAGAKSQIDDVVVQAPPGTITLDKTVDFGSTSPASGLFNLPAQATGTWTTTGGRFVGTAASAAAPAVNLIGYPVTPGSLIDIATTLKTSGQGGVVFDYHGPEYYKFATLSADSKQIIIGHRTGAVTTIDKTYSTTVSTTTDYKLGVTLRAGLVNVSLNGAVVASNLYNETVTVGGYGFISMRGATSGQTSFDIVRLKTDEAGYAAPAPLLAASATAATASATLTTAGAGTSSASTDTSRPTAALADPGNKASVPVQLLNSRKYLDVTFADAGSGIAPATIFDAAAEFTLSGAAAAKVTVKGTPTLVSGNTYRYPFTGQFKTGPVTVRFTTGSVADRAGNVNLASSTASTFTVSAAKATASVRARTSASTAKLSAASGKKVSAKPTIVGRAKASDAVLKSHKVKRAGPDLSWVGLLQQTKTRKEPGAAMPKTVDAVFARF